MSINIGPPSVDELRPRITVIGVGGAGGNAIANMIAADIEGVDFVVANTDAQALNNAAAEHRIQLGPDITQGLGAGSRPEVGRAAAEETVEDIERALEGVNMVFIAAGMGGGTGTGAAPVIAEIARKKGILTVGVVTKPFLFEGTRRMRAAEAGIDELQKNVDTLIVIPNQNLFLVAKADTTFREAFMLADEVLQQGVRSITDLMVMPGLINLDFADIRSVMNEMGKAMMGTGEGEGDNRALDAAERAIANPLLDGVSMQGAKGVIISIIGGEDMRLLEVDEAANHIRELVDPEANIIWGSAFNPDLDGKIRVSVVATGIEQTGEMAASAREPMSRGGVRNPTRSVLPLAAEDEVDEDEGEDSENDNLHASLTLPIARGPGESRETDELDLADESDDEHGGSDRALTEPNDDSDYGRGAEDGYPSARSDGRPTPGPTDPGDDEADGGAGSAERTFELTDVAEEPEEQGQAAPVAKTSGQDELLLDASRLADADQPVQAPIPGRKRRLFDAPGGDSGEGGGAASSPPGGSTLFERMANLSRSGKPSEEEEDEEDGDSTPSMRIPRFLGRQNNQ